MKPYKRIILVLVFLLFVMGAIPHLSLADHKADLEKIHQLYLEESFGPMVLGIKNLLKANPGPAITKNLINLLNEVYENKSDHNIPVDWSFPKEITFLDFSSKLIEQDGVSLPERKIWFGGHINALNIVTQMKLTQYPDKVILDKKAGIGSFKEYKLHGEPMFRMFKSLGREGLPLGLYTFEIHLKTQEKPFLGWFVLTQKLATQTPILVSPQPNEIIKDTGSFITFKNFTSPEYKPFEDRFVRIAIARGPDKCLKYVWETFLIPSEKEKTIAQKDITPMSASLMPHKEFLQQRRKGIIFGNREFDKFRPGRHILNLKFQEVRDFGPMILSRYAIKSATFYVENKSENEDVCE